MIHRYTKISHDHSLIGVKLSKGKLHLTTFRGKSYPAHMTNQLVWKRQNKRISGCKGVQTQNKPNNTPNQTKLNQTKSNYLTLVGLCKLIDLVWFHIFIIQ